MTHIACLFLDDSFEDHVLHHLHRMEIIMTQFADDQAHLDADVTAETTALATIIAELKAQHAAGAPLDFTKADAFVAAAQAEATTDAPAVVTPPVVTPPAPAATLYEHASASSFDPAQWPLAAVKAADGTALYTFAGDTAPGDALGASPDWTVYTGATQPV